MFAPDPFYEDYDVGKRIGVGGFSSVHLVRRKNCQLRRGKKSVSNGTEVRVGLAGASHPEVLKPRVRHQID